MIVGIDLGTTNSAIAVMRGEDVTVLPNNSGDRTTPSVVAFTEDGILVGKKAKNQSALNPKNTVASSKRIVGRRVGELLNEAKNSTYTMVGRKQDPVQILIGDTALMPQQISAKILAKLKKDAEDYIGLPITEAVITVPAYFNDGQRQATKQAGELAGLTVKRIINEPTAAALAYGIEQDGDKKVAVFDLGGGTFDISILEIGGGVWEVKSTNGNTFLGGDDFDREIVSLLSRHFKKNNDNVDLNNYPAALQRLKDAAESAKFRLSEDLETSIQLAILDENLPNSSLSFNLTRSKFDELISKHLHKITTCCKQALKDANLSASEIDEVVLVGGSTRVPAVRDLAKTIFGREPNVSVNPDEIVAVGAAIQGAILSGEKTDMVLIDVTPLSLGIETEYEKMDVLIPRNTAIPCIAKEVYTTTEDGQDAVDIYVYQGESNRVSRNRLLGTFILEQIEETYEGDPQIEVRFAIDADGILQVSARNLATGAIQKVTIKDTLSVSDSDKDTLTKAAELDKYDSEEDYDVEDLVTAADQLLEDTSQGLCEVGGELENDLVARVNKAKELLAEALDEENIEAIEARMETLMTLWEEVEALL